MLDSLTLILSYLVGSISFALVVGKLFFKKDIRQHGSGNLGAANTYRVLGAKAGVVVAILDIAKGTFACFLPFLLQVDVSPILCGICAIIGHVYPLYAGFKGGKAVATSTGVFLFLTPFGVLAGFVVFVITLIASKYVSLSSMLASVAILGYSFFFEDKSIFWFSLLVTIGVVILHRKNIQRIIDGTESRINKRR